MYVHTHTHIYVYMHIDKENELSSVFLPSTQLHSQHSCIICIFFIIHFPNHCWRRNWNWTIQIKYKGQWFYKKKKKNVVQRTLTVMLKNTLVPMFPIHFVLFTPDDLLSSERHSEIQGWNNILKKCSAWSLPSFAY